MDVHVTLRGLHAVLVLERERSFARAARTLGITQPSLSQLVRRVEEAVGGPLFERKPVKPTRAGRAFLERASASLAELEAAFGAASATLTGNLGTMRVGFTSSVVFSPIPTILAEFRRSARDVELALVERSTAEQLDQIAAGNLDVGFVRQFPDQPDLHKIRLFSEPFVAVVAQRHGLANRDRVPMAALAGEPFVHFPRGEAPSLYDELMRACVGAGFAPQVVQTASEWVTAVALVEAGVGVCLVPRSLTRLTWPGVSYVPIESSAARAEVFGIFRRADSNPLVRRFSRLLEGHARARDANEMAAPLI